MNEICYSYLLTRHYWAISSILAGRPGPDEIDWDLRELKIKKASPSEAIRKLRAVKSSLLSSDGYEAMFYRLLKVDK